mgnify:CR=1 FL=1
MVGGGRKEGKRSNKKKGLESWWMDRRTNNLFFLVFFQSPPSLPYIELEMWAGDFLMPFRSGPDWRELLEQPIALLFIFCIFQDLQHLGIIDGFASLHSEPVQRHLRHL